ncbi:hypothetical protein L226DRAFT_490389 [Lentinus tigrinus ALCF2SS1-7]|uniref:Uncharacterized protein n=1 Tax=Lentinus tigrinus ALCF2SS1-6 TaxID=1328759 RepID=A0A5C2S7I9_9APHY|nr:hypothetical protein L227DRAFT_611881 [Lentinus tigrinus ALCF2SS1-6]RPD72472.1 hypothetical protein L226DRAFT_490389 [Lentinus tigrinus ALCF2SS1-7]
MSSILPVARNAFKRASVRVTRPAASVAPRYYSSTMHDNDPEVLETEKRRNLAKEQHKTSTPIPEEAPGWNEALASASEAAVKADQFQGSPAELQQQTVKYVKDRHHSADTPTFKEPSPQEPGVSTQNMKHNGPDELQAPYSRDEIDGPLRSAHTVVETVEHKEDVITRKYA